VVGPAGPYQLNIVNVNLQFSYWKESKGSGHSRLSHLVWSHVQGLMKANEILRKATVGIPANVLDHAVAEYTRLLTIWENLRSFKFWQRCCWKFNSFDKLHCIVVGIIHEVSKGHSDCIFMVFLDCVILKMETIQSSETSGSIRVSLHKTCTLRETGWSVVAKRLEHKTTASRSGRFRRLLNYYTTHNWSFACPTIIRNILYTILYRHLQTM